MLDRRLGEIKNQRNGTTALSKFNHTYDTTGSIRSWTQQADSGTPTVFELGYDAADQLRWAIGTAGGASAQAYSYKYDTVGNRTSEQVSTATAYTVQTTSYNANNQLASRSAGGSMVFKGQLDEPAKVTVGGVTAFTRSDLTFVGEKTVSSGVNTVAIVATDARNNTRTSNYQLTVGGTAQSYALDDNGNLTTSGSVTYEYDGADRLVAVNNGTLRTEFTYDAFSRRVRIVEKNNGATTSDKRYVWCGSEICEERDAAGTTVLKQYFGQGVRVGAANYFYARDHLGSIREVVDSSGNIAARYSYDPYGRRTRGGGSYGGDFDFGYTGNYFHPSATGAAAGLELALYRAYSPDLGRWVNRDPIGEEGGINLYGFVGNDPIDFFDPLGLEQLIPFDPKALGGIGHPAFVAGDEKSGYQFRSFSTGDRSNTNTDNLEKKRFPNRKELIDHLIKKGYSRYVPVPSTAEEDRKAIEAIDKEFDSSNYNLLTQNCANMAGTGLKANSKLKGWFNWRPRGFLLNQTGNWFWSNPPRTSDLSK